MKRLVAICLALAVLPALAGADELSGIGTQAAGVAGSYAQMVCDDEITAGGRRLCRGFTVDVDSLAVEVITAVMEGKRNFLLDSAHNEDSARVLVSALEESYRFEKLVTIAGIVKDKDERGILENLAHVSDLIIVTDPVTHKDLDTERVFAAARSAHDHVMLIRDIEGAIQYAVEHSGPADMILVTGSFYTTSPARHIVMERWR